MADADAPAAAPAAAPSTEDSLLPDATSDSDDDADEKLVAGLSVEECVNMAGVHKEQGNEMFKSGLNDKALASYSEGLRYLTKHTSEAAAAPTLLSLHTNLAATHLRLERWAEARASAASALEIEPDLVKARFRRGVASFRLGALDEAKADLTAVCKADPKNRDARTELSQVVEALKVARSAERKSMSGLFSGQGGLYREEEARERRKRDEEARSRKKKREEEESLKQEWRDECARLKAERAAADGAAADGAAAEEPAAPAAAEGEAMEEEPPISFDDWKKQREEAAKAAKEKAEEEEKARKEAEAAERHRQRAKTDVVVVDDDDDLKGFTGGYKKRADGSTTTYFDRQVPRRSPCRARSHRGPTHARQAGRAAAARQWPPGDKCLSQTVQQPTRERPAAPPRSQVALVVAIARNRPPRAARAPRTRRRASL